VCEKQRVGNVNTPLLQTVQSGSVVMDVPNPVYVPVSRDRFDRMTVELYDGQGKPYSFKSSGDMVAQLRFRKKGSV